MASFELEAVRRRDVRRLRELGPPPGVRLPDRHAGTGDPRYPSPRQWRSVLSFTIDLLTHAGIALGVAVALARYGHATPLVILSAGVGTFLALSIADRVVVQWAGRSTVGKALVGLCLIRDDTGGRPTFGSLVKAWFLGALATVLAVLSG
jgi:hypothetical protein